MIWTVLTGDIVDSAALSADRLDDVMACLDRLSDDISAWGQGATIAFGRRGGDGWQLAVNAAEYTFRSTLYLQSSLMALDPAVQTRIAVATGKGTLSDANPNSAHGPAFSASGRLLETLSGNTLLAHAAGGRSTPPSDLPTISRRAGPRRRPAPWPRCCPRNRTAPCRRRPPRHFPPGH